MKEMEILKNRVYSIFKNGVLDFLKEINLTHIEDKIKIRIEYSRNEKFGDYSSSFLLENRELLGNRKDLPDLLINKLKNPLFSEITYSNPGFINFKISRNEQISYANMLINKDNYIYPIFSEPKKIIFEFVSANPTGPLNIVSARAAAMGASITNLLKVTGHDVYREFYVNDYGNQVFLLGVSCVIRLKEIKGESILFQEQDDGRGTDELINDNTLPLEGYRGEYLKEIVFNLYAKHKEKIENLFLKKSFNELIDFLSVQATQAILKSQKEDLLNFGVTFENFFSERELHDSSNVIHTFDELKNKNQIKEEEGKFLFKSTSYGDDKDRVVLREDGRPTYLLADIAYHKSKMDRGFEEIINIWGPDHHGYIARLKGSMLALGFPEDNFKILIAQQVNLISGGEKVKMSKRLGTFQTMKDLMLYLGENSKDIARYFFITRALDTPLDFDLDLAREESEKNPVFYLQYAHARIKSIFREVGTDFSSDDYTNIPQTEERDRLLFWICRFPEELYDSARAMEPHRLANYLQNLAKAFSKFYIARGNKLKDCSDDERRGLSFLLHGTSICIKLGLEILGISAPERMEKT